MDTKEVNSLREQVSQLETKYHEAKIKHEVRRRRRVTGTSGKHTDGDQRPR